jgi:hypothetical protein
LPIITDHQRQTNAKQYVAQIVLPLYELLTEELGLELDILGKQDNDKVPSIPVIFDFNQSLMSEKVQKLIDRHDRVTL